MRKFNKIYTKLVLQTSSPLTFPCSKTFFLKSLFNFSENLSVSLTERQQNLQKPASFPQSLEKLSCFSDIKGYLSTKDGDFSKTYLRKQHLAIVERCVSLKRELNAKNRAETESFIQILQILNKNLHFLVISLEDAQKPRKSLEKLIDNLIELQTFANTNFPKEIDKSCSFFTNLHFLRGVLRNKKDFWMFSLLEALENDQKLQENLLEMRELLSFNESRNFLVKLRKHRKKMEPFFRDFCEFFFSKRNFYEIRTLEELNSFFSMAQESNSQLKLEKKEVLSRFFDILQSQQDQWLISTDILRSLIFFLKKILGDFQEKSFILQKIRELSGNPKRIWDYENFLAFLTILRTFSGFFPAHNSKDNAIFLSYFADFYCDRKHAPLRNIITGLLAFDVLGNRILEYKEIVQSFCVENFVFCLKNMKEREFLEFFNRCKHITKINAVEMLRKDPEYRNIGKFSMNIQQKIVACYILGCKDHHLYDFNVEELRLFKDNQRVLSKIMCFAHYISWEFFSEVLESCKKNLKKSALNDDWETFVALGKEFFLDFKQKVRMFELLDVEELRFIQDRLNYELKTNNNISISMFKDILSVNLSHKFLTFSEKPIHNYLFSNINNFSIGDLALVTKDLLAMGQLKGEFLKTFQSFMLNRLDYATSNEIKNIQKILMMMNKEDVDFHFFQAFHEILLSRAIYPEYSPIIIEYLYYQAKYEKKKQYSLQTTITHLLTALKKNIYCLTPEKFCRFLHFLNKIEATFSPSMQGDFKEIFKEFIAKTDFSAVHPLNICFNYTGLFFYMSEIEGVSKVMSQFNQILEAEVALNHIKSYELARILNILTNHYKIIENHPEFQHVLHEILLKKAVESEFFLIPGSKNRKDIGLLSMVFRSLALLQFPETTTKFLRNFGNDLSNLIKSSIIYQEKGSHSINSPVFAKEFVPNRNVDLRTTFKNIQLIQIYSALAYLSCYFHDQPACEEKTFVVNKLKEIEKAHAFNKAKNSKNLLWLRKYEKDSQDSEFQENVFFLLNEKIFKKQQSIESEKNFGLFYVDIYIGQPFDTIIECNGPFHYKNGLLKMSDIRKYEIFRKVFKKKVIEINYLHWGSLKHGEQINYLKEQLGI